MSLPLLCFDVLKRHAIGRENAVDCQDVAKLTGLSSQRASRALGRLAKEAYGVRRIYTGQRITKQGKVRKTYVYYLEASDDVAAVLRKAPARPAVAQFDASALGAAW